MSRARRVPYDESKLVVSAKSYLLSFKHRYIQNGNPLVFHWIDDAVCGGRCVFCCARVVHAKSCRITLDFAVEAVQCQR